VSTPDSPISSGPGAIPVCYRHGERESYITCVRCQRTICPDCMTPASVGFQCPDCVAAGAAAVRPARTPFGATIAPRQNIGTISFIVICAVSFGLQWIVGLNESIGDFGMWPIGIALQGETYRLFTAAFLHASVLHIAMNMLTLWFLGPPLERVLGTARFVVLYLLCALGGSVASYVFSDLRTVSVGASGAIFGLMGALLVASRHLRSDISGIGGLIGVNLLIGFLVPGIDWRAHLGGLLTGMAVAFVLARAPSGPRQIPLQIVGCLGVVLVLVALTIWRTNDIRDQVGAFFGG